MASTRFAQGLFISLVASATVFVACGEPTDTTDTSDECSAGAKCASGDGGSGDGGGGDTGDTCPENQDCSLGGSGGGAPFATPCTEVPTGGEGGAGGAESASDTGWVWCEEGYAHRVAAVECSSQVPRVDDLYDNGSAENECVRDRDCSGHHEYCADVDVEKPPGNRCQQGCLVDADCQANQICDCGAPMGTCVAAYCKTDADCGAGTLCLKTDGPLAGNAYVVVPVLSCHKPEDECLTRGDCASDEACYAEAENRECREHNYN